MKIHDEKKTDLRTRFLLLHLSFWTRVVVAVIVALIIVVLKSKAKTSNAIPTFKTGTRAGITIGQASAPKKISHLLRVSD